LKDGYFAAILMRSR